MKGLVGPSVGGGPGARAPWAPLKSGPELNKYNCDVLSCCGPGNAHFISIRQVSLPVDFGYFASY